MIDGVPCVIPRSPAIVCVPGGISIDGVLCAFPITSVTAAQGVSVQNPASDSYVVGIEPVGAVTAICSSVAAKTNLIDCVLSNDAGNRAVLGTDGAIYVAPPAADVNVSGMTLVSDILTVTETDGQTHSVSLAPYVNAAAFVHPTPLQHITDICASAPAKAALVDCVLSSDADNTAVVGSDGGIYVPQLHRFVVRPAQVTGNLPSPTGPVPAGVFSTLGTRTVTITNPSPTRPLKLLALFESRFIANDFTVSGLDSLAFHVRETTIDPVNQIFEADIPYNYGTALVAPSYRIWDQATSAQTLPDIAPGASRTFNFDITLFNSGPAVTQWNSANQHSVSMTIDCWNV
jgi:hypothetical protein